MTKPLGVLHHANREGSYRREQNVLLPQDNRESLFMAHLTVADLGGFGGEK